MIELHEKVLLWNKCVRELGKYPTNSEMERYLRGEIAFEQIQDIHEEMDAHPERAKEIHNDRFTM